MNKRYEQSCGVVVLNRENDTIKVLLVHHQKGHWGIPKGHVEPNEKEEETAIREVLEETGISTDIIEGFREVITYSPCEGVSKDVVFFLGNAKNTDIKVQEEELKEAIWIDLEKGPTRITYKEEKEVIKKVIKDIHS